MLVSANVHATEPKPATGTPVTRIPAPTFPPLPDLHSARLGQLDTPHSPGLIACMISRQHHTPDHFAYNEGQKEGDETPVMPR